METFTEKKTIAAVVVTFNRLELLKDAIKALRIQTLRPEIIIVNNGSTDGTTEYLATVDDIRVINQANVGGAGGFYTGMKYACEKGFDYVWVMDDDVIPASDALETLYNDYSYLSLTEKVGYLCSRVLSTDDVANVPIIDYRPNTTGYPDWGKYLDKGLIKTESATFVSVFIPTEVIFKVGLPYQEFFIWGDDTEFTRRITNVNYTAYLSGKSEIIHRRVGGALDIRTFKDKNRIKMYRFSVRNNIFILRKFDSKRALIKQLYIYSKIAIKQLFLCQFIKTKVIITGIFNGFFFYPKLRYPAKN